MRRTLKDDGTRRISEATIARRLSVASSFFTYAAAEGTIDGNPIAAMKRPKRSVDEDGIVWLDTAEMKTFLAAAKAHSLRSYALAALMLTTGARISEALAADVADLGHTGGHRVLIVTRKGGKRQNLPLAPWVGTAIDTYLDGRTDGPLFATAARAGGHGRLDQPAVHRLIRRLAKNAGLPQADALHPHSLRHSAITGALEAGGSLRNVQAMAGHADPRTTERYDRMRGRLDSSPVHALAAALAD
jgi:site-specific recombinase XerD